MSRRLSVVVTETQHAESTRRTRPRSTLLAIMGRMAAYTGQEITWEQALNSQERLVPEKLDWNMALEAPPMAMPGITKFV